MLDGAGSSLGCRGSHVNRSMPREHDSRDAGLLCRPKGGTKVVRICHAVEHEEERRSSTGIHHERVEVRLVERPSQRYDSLMGFGARDGFQSRPRHCHDANPACTRQSLDLVQLGRRIQALGDQELLNRSSSGREQLQHCAPSLDLLSTEPERFAPGRASPFGVAPLALAM
jgi:hypothetical protein